MDEEKECERDREFGRIEIGEKSEVGHQGKREGEGLEEGEKGQ